MGGFKQGMTWSSYILENSPWKESVDGNIHDSIGSNAPPHQPLGIWEGRRGPVEKHELSKYPSPFSHDTSRGPW